METSTLETSTRVDVQLSRKLAKSLQATFLLAAGEPARLLGDTDNLPPEIVGAAQLLLTGPAAPAKGELLSTVVHVAGKSQAVHVLGMGVEGKITPDALRAAAATVIRTALRQKLTSVTLLLPQLKGLLAEPVAAALTEGALLAGFDFTGSAGRRKSKDLASRKPLTLDLLAPPDLADAVRHAKIAALSTNFARTIASRPGNDINPVSLAAVARSLASKVGLKCSVLDDKQMRKLGMGGLLGVGGGSPTPPRLIALEHKPAKAPKNKKPLLIVGKSITFDTGGISIKPAERMGRMIYDKCGGMAVLGLMHALAVLKVPVHVVGLLTAAENHVSGNSYRPGDVLTMYNGITVEITNTDAEGRLVLADAIAWGIDTYKPAAVVDLATLTGGCVVALGTTMAGLFSNSDALAAEISAAASAAGERLWRLPVGDDQRDMLKADLADVVNSAGRYASPLTGAAFISLFVPEDGSVPWAHLDIAGVADTDKNLPYLGKGATGYGVRTLLHWVESKATAR